MDRLSTEFKFSNSRAFQGFLVLFRRKMFHCTCASIQWFSQFFKSWGILRLLISNLKNNLQSRFSLNLSLFMELFYAKFCMQTKHTKLSQYVYVQITNIYIYDKIYSKRWEKRRKKKRRVFYICPHFTKESSVQLDYSGNWH